MKHETRSMTIRQKGEAVKLLIISLSLCLSLTLSAAEDEDAVVILSAVPSATSIVKTSYGYRINTAKKTRFANRTSFGYSIPMDRGTTFINRTSSGFRIQPSR